MLATTLGKVDMVNWLIEKGADLEAVDRVSIVHSIVHFMPAHYSCLSHLAERSHCSGTRSIRRADRNSDCSFAGRSVSEYSRWGTL